MKQNVPGAWFRPKRIGWGISPNTWEGWLVTVLAVVLVLYLVTQLVTG